MYIQIYPTKNTHYRYYRNSELKQQANFFEKTKIEMG